MVSVSVVIPIYNGAKYLPQTLASVVGQEFRDFELVCVDDASTDDSVDVVRDATLADPRVKVRQIPTNSGAAVKCLAHVLPELEGDYFFYCSQDDVLSRDCLRLLVDRARATGADVVLPDMVWWHEGAEGDDKRLEPPHGDYDAVLSGREAFELSLDWTVHGFSLRAMPLTKRIGYPGDELNADEYVTRAVLLAANKVAFAPGVFYYRQDNAESLTRRFNARRFDWLRTDLRLLGLIEAAGLPERVYRERLRVAAQESWRMRLQFRLRGSQWVDLADRTRAKTILEETASELRTLCKRHRVAYTGGLVRLVRAKFRRSLRRRGLLLDGAG